jgi:hypothetical protein
LLTLLIAAGFLVAAWQSMSASSDWLRHLGPAQLSVWVTLFIAAVVGLNQTRHLVFDDQPESMNAASDAIELVYDEHHPNCRQLVPGRGSGDLWLR